MRYKYVMISGFAFSEEADLRKLENLAKRGWILDGITSLFFRLRKEEPQNLKYSLDYQSDYDEEYFHLFQEAGWTHRGTIGEHVHIFSAPEGTTPLYLDAVEQSEQYLPLIRTGALGGAVSLAFLLFFGALMRIINPSGWISHLLLVSLILSWIAFVFCFFPCVGYLVRRLRAVRSARQKV